MRVLKMIRPSSLYVIFLVLALISCSADKGECPFCNMKMPHDARVKVLVEGDSKPKMACSIMCVLNYQKATGKKIKFLHVSDFNSGKFLDPKKAFYVVGSDVNPFDTMLHGHLFSQSRTPIYMDWSRYTPTILAFASERDAEKFQMEHGGRVATFSVLQQAN